jgi:alkanesulfonate monooxygenase SsuD/methylene tetrahydromethanopterin reductase-like flavin-dependent oxidoreductase (luciferase family)
MGAQSEGATRRAARLTDGVFFGPQLGWADIARFAGVFREARAAAGLATPGFVGASRSLIVGESKEEAAAAARGYLEKTFTMYRTWRMQERTMGTLRLGFEASLDDWTIHGSPADCVETLERARALGLERIGFTIYSLPPGVRARIDYLRMIAEEIVAPVSHAPRA